MEKIFLTYANNSLRDTPKNFYVIFKEIERFEFFANPKHIQAILKRIIALSKYNDPGVVDTFLKLDSEKKLQKDAFIKIPFEAAADAVYGYRNGYCENKCFWRSERRKKFGEELFVGSNRLKCYECNQLEFISILDEITKGREYSRVWAFESLLLDSNNLRKTTKIDSSKNGNGFKEQLRTFITWDRTSPLGFGNKKNGFSDFLSKIISHGLVEFLLHNNRNRLKRCPICQKFFIAKDSKRQICYTSPCKKEYERLKKQKQRKVDPVKYT